MERRELFHRNAAEPLDPPRAAARVARARLQRAPAQLGEVSSQQDERLGFRDVRATSDYVSKRPDVC